MKIEHLRKLNEHFKNSATWGYVLFYDKIEDKKVDVCLTYNNSIQSVILCGDDSEIYDLDELVLIDERFTKTKIDSEKRYIIYVKGDFESVHYSSRGEIIQVDGYFADTQSMYSDTSFTDKLLCAKTWKRKKDAENRLTAITSKYFNKHKNLVGEVIEVSIAISY